MTADCSDAEADRRGNLSRQSTMTERLGRRARAEMREWDGQTLAESYLAKTLGEGDRYLDRQLVGRKLWGVYERGRIC